MATPFSDNHITDLGSNLVAQVLTGGTITFTRIVLGNGDMPGTQTPETMTDVISPKLEGSITKASVTDQHTAVIGTRISNDELDESFEWKELGIYAKGSDEVEVLYSYGYTPSGQVIPAYSADTDLIEELVDLVTYVGDAATVDAVFDYSIIPPVERIAESDIDAMWDQGSVDPTTGKSSQYLDRPGLSKLVHDIADAIANAGPNITADEVTVSMTAEGVLSIKALGVGTAQLADASVTTAKLADGAVTAAKIADGAVTASKLAPGLGMPAGGTNGEILSYLSNAAGWSKLSGLFGLPAVELWSGTWESATITVPGIRDYSVYLLQCETDLDTSFTKENAPNVIAFRIGDTVSGVGFTNLINTSTYSNIEIGFYGFKVSDSDELIPLAQSRTAQSTWYPGIGFTVSNASGTDLHGERSSIRVIKGVC